MHRPEFKGISTEELQALVKQYGKKQGKFAKEIALEIRARESLKIGIWYDDPDQKFSRFKLLKVEDLTVSIITPEGLKRTLNRLEWEVTSITSPNQRAK